MKGYFEYLGMKYHEMKATGGYDAVIVEQGSYAW